MSHYAPICIFLSAYTSIDGDDFARNLAHKLAAAGVGCVIASAKKQDCNAGAIGAAVGEMVGDYLVEQGNESNLSAEDKRDILNRAKLVAGTVALAVGADVDTAANSAGVAVENNAINWLPDHCITVTNCMKEFREQGGIISRQTSMHNDDWQLIEILDKDGWTVGYTAYNKITKNTDFIIRRNEIQDFMNAHPDNIRLAVDLAKLATNKPQYQHDAEMAIMNRDFKAFNQSWKDALTSPSYYLFLATNASGTIVAKSAVSKVYVYRKMSITEANLTLRTNKLQPPKIGSNSSKYLSEDL